MLDITVFPIKCACKYINGLVFKAVEIFSTDKKEKCSAACKSYKNAFLNTNDSTFTELVQCHIYEFAPMTFRINS